MKILNNFEQGSLEWQNLRCGKITMSRANDLLAGGRGITRQNYILDLVAERLSGEPADRYIGLDMQRGTFLEDWAIKAFETATSLGVERVGFVLHDDERIGCSPDGFTGDGAGIEIEWHDWAKKMGRTHKQERCPNCGLWAIWTEKQK